MEGVNKDVSNDPRATLPGEAGAVGVDGAGDGGWVNDGDTRPRYDLVRNLNKYATTEPDRTRLEHAAYDIVDNHTGHERVLARNVRYDEAKEIVKALNVMHMLGASTEA